MTNDERKFKNTANRTKTINLHPTIRRGGTRL